MSRQKDGKEKSLLNAKTKKEIMVDMLREAILSGELQPGERLLQEELAERFNVSPTPIREAIQQLVAEGVLSHSPYKGVQVAEAKLEDMREVYLIRSVVERLATSLAVPNLKLSDVRRLHELQTEIEAEIATQKRRTIIKPNHEFHMIIYGAAGMPYLQQIISTLWIKSPWDTLFVIPNRASMTIAEHRAILNAIDRGDAELAGQRMQEHIEQGLKVLAEFLRQDTKPKNL